jgi:hypothetical protein
VVDEFRVQDLTVEGRQVFDRWRAFGLSESEALAECRALDHQSRLAERFQRRGLSPVAARVAAAGRDGVAAAAHPFDRLVELYRRRGMDPQAARLSAIGRGRTEFEAREAMSPARPAPARAVPPLPALRQRETQPRAAAGRGAGTPTPAGSRPVRVAEDGRAAR